MAHNRPLSERMRDTIVFNGVTALAERVVDGWAAEVSELQTEVEALRARCDRLRKAVRFRANRARAGLVDIRTCQREIDHLVDKLVSLSERTAPRDDTCTCGRWRWGRVSHQPFESWDWLDTSRRYGDHCLSGRCADCGDALNADGTVEQKAPESAEQVCPPPPAKSCETRAADIPADLAAAALGLSAEDLSHSGWMPLPYGAVGDADRGELHFRMSKAARRVREAEAARNAGRTEPRRHGLQ